MAAYLSHFFQFSYNCLRFKQTSIALFSHIRVNKYSEPAAIVGNPQHDLHFMRFFQRKRKKCCNTIFSKMLSLHFSSTFSEANVKFTQSFLMNINNECKFNLDNIYCCLGRSKQNMEKKSKQTKINTKHCPHTNLV